ncbi:hypothetical protein [Brevundimonas sp.]|uniref:hypothetical protein n=1 Tax=Brevundimonas sp. TaxID=1871086 RepID=UPI0025BFD092|nr:hypothetical protein [Brevundimonas sp.]
MKSRNRPPLKLTNDEAPVEPVETVEAVEAPAEGLDTATEHEPDAVEEAVTEPAHQPEPVLERPMSERRRRRLLEEQRQAEERAAAELAAKAVQNQTFDIAPHSDSVATPESATAPNVAVEMAVAAGAPPAPIKKSTAPAVKTTAAQRQDMPSGRHAYLIAGVASTLWIGGVASWAAYEFGAGGAELDGLRIAIYALIALAPAGLAIMLAHAVRQGAGLAAETKRARDLAEALVAPTALAARQTGEVLHSLRSDIDHAALAAERARNDMALLREALAQETNRLNEAAENASRTARRLTEGLGREREEMTKLGVHLDSQSEGVIVAVERQSRMVADASDLAQAQLREAEAALAASPPKIWPARPSAWRTPVPASPNKSSRSKKVWASNGQPWSPPPINCAPIRKTSPPRSKASAPRFWSSCPPPAPPPLIWGRPHRPPARPCAIWSRRPQISSAPWSTCPSARPTASTPPPRCRWIVSKPWPPRPATP